MYLRNVLEQYGRGLLLTITSTPALQPTHFSIPLESEEFSWPYVEKKGKIELIFTVE